MAVLPSLWVLLGACGGDSGSGLDPADEPSRLVVTVTSAGTPADGDGYTAVVNPGNVTRAVPSSGQVVFEGLSPGQRQVSLDGIAAHCAVDRPEVSVSVPTGGSASAEFEVTCTPWERSNLQTPLGIEDLHFRDAQNGFAVARGTSANLLTTDDGGRTWRFSALESPGDLGTFVDFATDDLGFVGGQHGYLARTTDGGTTWSGSSIVDTERWLLSSYFFPDGLRGFVGGGGGLMLHTADGGETWSTVDVGFTQPIFAIAFTSDAHGVYAGSSARIAVTDDGGATWSPTVPVALTAWQDLAFANESVGVAVGTEGHMARTTDGGYTWEPVASGVSVDLWGVDFGTGGFGVVVGSEGTILVTRDAGATWQMEGPLTGLSFSGVFALDEDHAWIGGGSGWALRRMPGG